MSSNEDLISQSAISQPQEGSYELMSVKWFILNIWRHPLHVIFRIHSESSWRALAFIILVSTALSLFPTAIEILFAKSDPSYMASQTIGIPTDVRAQLQEMYNSGYAIRLVNSLEYFLLVSGFFLSYIFFRLLGSVANINLPVMRVFAVLKSPLKILRSAYEEESAGQTSILLILLPAFYLVFLSILPHSSRHLILSSLILLGSLVIFFIATFNISAFFGGKASFHKTMVGLTLSLFPIAAGITIHSLNDHIFKLLITPLYAKISPMYYEVGSMRNLEGPWNTFTIGEYILIALLFIPSILFVFRRYHELSWVKTILVLSSLGIIYLIYYGVFMFLYAMSAVT